MFEQEGRICKLTTKLGTDKLLVRRLAGWEGMSRPFQFQLELLAEDDALDFNALIGKPALVEIALAGGGSRPIHGLISRFTQGGADRRFTVYHAELVPWLWLLTRRADCRIFQGLAVPDIVKQVFTGLKLSDFELRLDGQYEPWVYCVQYRESDFNFVSRLLEAEGIHYFFEHSAKAHKLILADSPSRNPPCPGQPNALYDPARDRHGEADAITAWAIEHALQSGAYALSDFNFMDPATSLLVAGNSSVPEGGDTRLEVYDYPGEYVNLGQEQDAKLGKGEARVKLRRQEGDQQACVVRGESDCRAFAAGCRFDLDGHFRADQNNAAYLLTEVHHELTQEASFETTGAAAERWTSGYANHFTCIPHAVPFRPPRQTPTPRVAGPQTAFVVGPKGEEIHVDKHGRVKVQFHWDRQGQADDKSSCWIRVAQSWAGKQWGGVFIPRIGHEVVVEFLEGDPDQPLITGSVYNSAAMPPYALPANMTRSGVKTDSSKGSGGCNEIRFEDKKGSEELFLQAEKDQTINVKNDCHETIGHDRHLIVKNDQFEQVDNNRHEKVGADHVEEIGKDRNVRVLGKDVVQVDGSRTVTVKGDVTVMHKASHYQEVGDKLHLTATSVVVEGMSKLSLKVGGSCVVVDSSGVTIKGATVVIDGGMTKINSGPGTAADVLGSYAVWTPPAPAAPVAAGSAVAGSVVAVTPHKPPQTAEEKAQKPSWIEIELVDEDGAPVPGERYRIELPDGSVAQGTLDAKGVARVEGIEPGNCKITFPNLDKDAWEKA